MARRPFIAPVITTALAATIVTGPIVQELRQPFRAGYGQTLRLYSGDTDGYHGNAVEIEHSLGPIDTEVELVSRWATGLNTNGTFYSDDNGLEFQTRAFNYTKAELVAGNYFPMVARAYVQDAEQQAQFTVLSDSTHGAGSMANGELEVMLHRRCIDDDGRGVGETLNETLYFQPSLWAVLSPISDAAKLHRRLSLLQSYPLAAINVTAVAKPFSPLVAPLPDNLHLLSLRTLYGNNSQTILRLQHVFEVNEDAQLSQPVKIDLQSIFAAPYAVNNAQLYNLVANVPASEVKRPVLQHDGEAQKSHNIDADLPLVTLSAMEIKTFIVDFTA